MVLIAAIERLQDRLSVQSGPRGPSAMRKAILNLPPTHRPPNYRVQLSTLKAADFVMEGAKIKHIAAGVRRPALFNPQYVRLPMLERMAPLGIHDSRNNLIKGIMLQHAAQVLVVNATMFGVLALLLTLQPVRAFALFHRIDLEAAVFESFYLDAIFRGLPQLLFMLFSSSGRRRPHIPPPPPGPGGLLAAVPADGHLLLGA